MFEHLQPEAVTIRIEGLLKMHVEPLYKNGDHTDKHEEWTVRIGDSANTRWDCPYVFYDDIWLVVWNIFHNIWDNPSHWLSYFSTRYGEDPYRNRSSLKGNVLLQGILFDWLDEERVMRKSGSCLTGEPFPAAKSHWKYRRFEWGNGRYCYGGCSIAMFDEQVLERNEGSTWLFYIESCCYMIWYDTKFWFWFWHRCFFMNK